MEWQDKRSGVWKGVEHLTSGTFLILSGATYSIGTEGIGTALGGGALITLGSAEMALGMANLLGDKRSNASRANNFLELIGKKLEKDHKIENASTYLYYAQEVIEVGTSIKNASNFIKSGNVVGLPKNMADVAKNAKAYYGVYTTAIKTPTKIGKLLYEGFYDIFIANTDSESLRNLDLESWKATIEFVDANINKIENYIGVKVGFEILDKDGDLFVSDDFNFKIKNEGRLQTLLNDMKSDAPKRKNEKEKREEYRKTANEGRIICFVSGTKICVKEGGLKNIEEIKINDQVYCYDFKNKKSVLRNVLATHKNKVNGLIEIYIKKTKITSTSRHPFYVENKGWTPANDLKKGDVLKTIDSKIITVDNIKILNKEEEVYNFQVEENSNYYITNHRVLVHNESYILDEKIDVSKN